MSGARTSLPWRAALVVTICALTVGAASTPAAAVPPGWSTPAKVFSHTGAPTHAMVVDTAGAVHIATEKGSQGIFYVKKVGGDWIETQVSTGDDHEPSIAVDGGVVYIAFARRTVGEEGLFTVAGNAAWTAELRFAGAVKEPSLAMRSGTYHIAFRAPGSKLKYARGTSGGAWTIETIDGSCCISGPDLALTDTGGVRVAYGDGTSHDPSGLKYAARTSSGWQRTLVQSGRVKQVAIALNLMPGIFPWDPPSNAPNIAYVRKGSGSMYTFKGSSGVNGAWQFRHLGAGAGPTDITHHSNELNVVFGGGGKLWIMRMSGGIYQTWTLSGSGNDWKPQLAAFGGNEKVTFARSNGGSSGVFLTQD